MDALTEMYRSAYFNSLKQIIIDKANAIIKTNSNLKEEYDGLVAACTEFRQALGKEEVNADDWAFSIIYFIENCGAQVDSVSESLRELRDTDPSKFNSEK